MIDKEANIAVINKFWNSVREKDMEGYLSVFTSQAVAHDPVNKPSLESSEQRRDYMQGVFDNFEQIEPKIDFITTCGERTANKWTVVGTLKDGSQVTIEGVDCARHDSTGLIDELWGYFDN